MLIVSMALLGKKDVTGVVMSKSLGNCRNVVSRAKQNHRALELTFLASLAIPETADKVLGPVEHIVEISTEQTLDCTRELARSRFLFVEWK